MSFNGELLVIFSWLPASVLCKFSTVCQSSRQLLDEPYFIKKQFKNMLQVGDFGFFIEPNYAMSFPTGALELHSIMEPNTSILCREIMTLLANKYRIICSNNGLLFCRNSTYRTSPSLMLLNPTTMSYLSIYDPDKNPYMDYVFECFEDDYLLMEISSPREWGAKFILRTYSFEKNEWRDGGSFRPGSRNILLEQPVAHNGTIYIVSDTEDYIARESEFFWPYIVIYEVKNLNSRILQIPKRARKGGFKNSKLRIFKWDGNSLCLVKLQNNVFTIWRLLIESDKWELVFKSRIRAMGLLSEEKVAGFTIINEDLLFATKEKVHRYNIMSNRAGEVCSHHCGKRVRFNSFTNTLRPPVLH